jgi:hypothetical protein
MKGEIISKPTCGPTSLNRVTRQRSFWNSSRLTKTMVRANNSGDNVDNWNINDLETLVDLYKRSLDKPGVYNHYKLQEIDLDVLCNHKGLA